jgi:type IV pilus assembly protein PilF
MQLNKGIVLLKSWIFGLFVVFAISGCVTTGNAGMGATAVDKDKALELHIKLAQGYVNNRNRESARHHLRKAFDIDKNSAEAEATLALLYQLEGEPELAEKSFLKSLKKKKDFTSAQNNYGVFLFDLKRYSEALLQFEKAAADLDYDGRALALVNVGRTSLQLGHKVRAKAAFEHATVLDRKLPEAFIELAAMNFEDQEYAAAKKNLDKFMDIGQHTARGLLLGIRLERIFGNKDREASYLLILKNRFPYSKEYLEYKQTMLR